MHSNSLAFRSSLCRILEICITVAKKAQTRKLRLLLATYIKRTKYNPLWLGFQFGVCNKRLNQSQWPRGLRRRSAGRSPAEIVGSHPTGGMDVCCDCCVLSGRGLCDELITRPEESYRLWCVVVCDLENSRMRRPWPALGRSAPQNCYIL